jgi:hypothetical protein
MSNRYKNNNTYSASDIEKYLKGELSALEMNELEQAALEDPFLGDALEGMAVSGASLNQDAGSPGSMSMLDADLAELRNRLAARTMANDYEQAAPISSTPEVGMPTESASPAEDASAGHLRPRTYSRPFSRRLAAAASLILLLGLGLLTYFMLRPGAHSQTTLAKTEPPAPLQALDTTTSKSPTPNTTAAVPLAAAPPAAAQSTTPLSADSTTQLLAEKRESAAVKTVESKSREEDKKLATPTADAGGSEANLPRARASRAGASQGIASQDIASQDIASQNAAPAGQSKSLPGLATTPVYQTKPGPLADTLGLQNSLLFKKKSMGSAFISRQLDNSLVFRGIVLDQQDHPLAGASLFLNGDPNIGTTTDQEGQFKLQLRPQDSTRQLRVSLVGYKEAYLALNIINTDGPAGNVIRMQPHSQSFDEVVVVGYGAQRKETLAAVPTASNERLDSLWQTASPVIGSVAYRQYLDSAKKTLSLDPAITGVEAISFEVDRNGALTSFKIEQSLSPAHDAGLIRIVREGPAWRMFRGKKVRAAVSVSF